MILSSGVLKMWWSATVSSATPRLELRWPPVFDTVYTISSLSSSARFASSYTRSNLNC